MDILEVAVKEWTRGYADGFAKAVALLRDLGETERLPTWGDGPSVANWLEQHSPAKCVKDKSE